jgi:hypothetical protein
MYAFGDPPIPLCVQCAMLHNAMMQQQLAAAERGIERAMDDMEMVTGVQLRPRRPPAPAPIIVQGAAFHNINIRDSNVGVVNSGDLQLVDSAISVIANAGDARLAVTLKDVTEAIHAQGNLDAGLKREAIEIVSAIATEATQPVGQRRFGVARPLIARLREILSTTADLATVAQAAIPIIAAAFGG